MKGLDNIDSLDGKRASDIIEVIMSYARLDFSVKTSVSNNDDVLDAIASGVNMLGEELNSSTVSLKEKDQLLREIHHRVKNNMQIISSLLNLQSDNEKDARVLDLIKDSRSRINSMAIIHEMLYANTNFVYTNFREYVEKLTQSLLSSYLKRDNKIEFVIEIEDSVCFDIDKMIPLGLILNEVITNSLKYAFPSEKSGTIIIKLSQSGKTGKNELQISDNGIGLIKHFDVKIHGNLGMQLINMLTEQIDGEVSLKGNKGTEFTISFR